MERGRGEVLVLLLLLVFASPARAAEPAAVEAPQPVVVPPGLEHFEEAKLPPELDVTPGTYVVTLTLTVDEAGAVTEVLVAASDLPSLDALAVGAAKGFRFSPATVDGTPVPVQITYRYTFDVSKKEKRVVARFLVKEKGKRRPLEGVTAFVEETAARFTSDASGLLEVADLAPGTYTLYVPEDAFEEARETFQVAEGTVPERSLYVLPRTGVAHQTVIRAPREARFVARQSLQWTELRRLPGSGGDPLKMIENLPGIARSAFGSGMLVVFGSHPMDSMVFVDGMPLWQLYHFGGLYSIIHPDYIDRIDFVPAGFDGTYGRAIGGVVDVRLKEQPLDGWHGAFDVNLLHAGAMVGGPYSDDGDVQVAFRRSYVDAILSALASGIDDLSLTTAPRYYDYQARVQHRFSSTNRLQVFVNGSDDRLEMISKRMGPDPTMVGDLGFSQQMHALLVRWMLDPTPEVQNELSFHASVMLFELSLFNIASADAYQWPILLRDQVDWKLGDALRLRVGLEGGVYGAYMDATSPGGPPREGQAEAPMSEHVLVRTVEHPITGIQSAWVSAEWKPVERWTLVPSLRLDAYEGAWDAWSLDPRLSTRVDVTDTLSLRAATGLFSQFPRMDKLSQAFGNPDLPPERAIHALVGGEWRPWPRLSISSDVFYKHLFDLADFSNDQAERYQARGKGRAYGATALVRLDPGGRVFGWISYTYVVSELWDFDDLDTTPGYVPNPGWKPSSYDQRHLLNALVSVDLGAHWSVGARFRLATGYPYTPVDGSIFDSDGDQYTSLPSRDLNAGRMPLFHALDLRVDKEWAFDTWMLALYLEVQNVYNHRNVEGIQYNYDYTEQGYVYGLPILPVLGVRGEF
jgi:TonB family protein